MVQFNQSTARWIGGELKRTVTATEARVHFGELLQRVTRDQDTVTVERGGGPQAVVMSVAEYERLRTLGKTTDWRERARAAREIVRAEVGDKPLPAPADLVHAMRAERDEELGLPR